MEDEKLLLRLLLSSAVMYWQHRNRIGSLTVSLGLAVAILVRTFLSSWKRRNEKDEGVERKREKEESRTFGRNLELSVEISTNLP